MRQWMRAISNQLEILETEMMQSELIGKYVIVRTYSAGVHAGLLAAKEGKEVRLTKSRRIWRWEPASEQGGTLSGVATEGVGPGSKIGNEVDLIELTEAIEVIECSETAEVSIRGAKWAP
jgi:hypothetical protein